MKQNSSEIRDSDKPANSAAATANANDLLSLPHSHQAILITKALGVEVEKGLSGAEAAKRLKRDGANTLEESGGLTWRQILLAQFSSIVVWLLAAAAGIALLTGEFLEAAAILVVLVFNAAAGFAIEWQAGRALEALRRKTRLTAKVRRDGAETIIKASGLAAGDIIILTAGDRVPADARLVEAVNLRTDESTLTGESLPVEKSIDSVHHASLLAERRSMLYLGTIVVAGRALAVVTATGARTELGRIGQLIAETGDETTPLEQRLADLGRRLVYVVLGIAAIVMIAGFVRGDEIWLMLKVAISLAVAAVPEGLPAVTTLILALGVLRMARRHAIVRRLAAVETLGSTTVICTDKTGTLTENRMTVQEYRLADDRVVEPPENSADSLKTNGQTKLGDEIFSRLLRVSLLCNEASFDASSEGDSRSIGDPTETALLISAHRCGFDVARERASFQKLVEQPFEATTKRMIEVLQDKNGNLFAAMKGAPAVVLAACTHFAAGDNRILPLDEENRRQLLEINETMASRALRVLAFADKQFDDADSRKIYDGKSGDIETGYTFLGFAGMNDPLREGVREAVREAHRAGIRVVMLTGDQMMTARAIARELNLSENGDVFALHAGDLTEADSRRLADLARQAHVFARVSPEDKLRIVEALQQSGEIVAVTGDGVNDAPALKRADIGIAMGERGTEVAKEASDVVLTDDNFSTIVKAIEGGRTIYSNIIKFVHFLFTANLAEVMVIFIAIMVGLPLPLLPLQILWINLVTDIFPAFALALEPSVAATMRRRPRPPDEALLSNRFLLLIGWQGAMLACVALAAYFWALRAYGEGAHSRTVVLLALVGVQIGHLFNCRSRTRSIFEGFGRNPFVFAATAVVIALQLAAIYFAPLARVLDTVQPTKADWIAVSLCVFLPVVIVETAKAFGRRKAAGSVNA